jgi:hypothetical protein
MSEQTEIDFINDDYNTILKLYTEIVAVLEEVKLPSEEVRHLRGFSRKLCFHASSALKLAEGTEIKGISFSGKTYDFSSVVVLVRSALECYASLHYYFFEAVTPEEKDFRFVLSAYNGLSSRKEIDPLSDNATEQLQRDTIELQNLWNEIQKFARFQNMKARQKNLVERGKLFTNKTEMIDLTNYSEKTRKIFYSYLSDFTHSGYISLLQIEQNDTLGKQKSMLEIGLAHLAIIMSLTIFDLAKKYSQVQELLSKFPTETELVRAYSEANNFYGS